MARVDVITPTIRHDGIILVARCLERQVFTEFRWIIVDHDHDIRWFADHIPRSLWHKTIYVPPKVQEPKRKYKLWNTRNTAYQFLDSDLTVEIQDYHWISFDALDKFWALYEQYPKSLFSAYYKIVGFKGYEKAMMAAVLKDEDLDIIDLTERIHLARVAPITQSPIPYLGYEMNVSSIPTDILKKIVPADEEMDDGYLVDTHYISIPAMLMDCPIFISTIFPVYSFEHKLLKSEDKVYAETEKQEYMGHELTRPKNFYEESQINQRFLMKKYGKELSEWIGGHCEPEFGERFKAACGLDQLGLESGS